jgi:hypothetical protein
MPREELADLINELVLDFLARDAVLVATSVADNDT